MSTRDSLIWSLSLRQQLQVPWDPTSTWARHRSDHSKADSHLCSVWYSKSASEQYHSSDSFKWVKWEIWCYCNISSTLCPEYWTEWEGSTGSKMDSHAGSSAFFLFWSQSCRAADGSEDSDNFTDSVWFYLSSPQFNVGQVVAVWTKIKQVGPVLLLLQSWKSALGCFLVCA